MERQVCYRPHHIGRANRVCCHHRPGIRAARLNGWWMILRDTIHDPTLVGRDSEQRALAAALADAAAGRGQLVLVSGEAGIGKSTLVEAVELEAQRLGLAVLTGRCYDLSADQPYGLWSDLGRALPADPGLPPFPAAITQTVAEARVASQHTLLQELAGFFTALAARGPLLLVLEDIHWADADSLTALRVLARMLRALPVLTVATYRSDELTRRHVLHQLVPQLVREARAERLVLQPLAEDDIRAYLRASWPMGEADEARLVAYLAAQAEGNPLFVVELLRTLVEDRVLTRTTAGWSVGALQQGVVPLLVQQVIDARLSHLSAPTRHALEAAAVIGHDVPWDVWSRVVDLDGDTMAACVREAVETHMLREQPGGERLQFSHALVRETHYGRLTIPERRALHRRVAEALIDDPAPDPDVVAFHFRQAHDERLTHWLIQAGIRAGNAYALRVAADRLGEALRRMGPSDERGWLLYSTAMLLRFADQPQAIAYLDEAAREAERLGDRALRAYAICDGGMLRCFQGGIRQGLADIQAGYALLEELVQEPPMLDPQTAAQVTHYRPLGREAPGAQYRVTLRRGTLVSWMAASGRLREAQELGERFLAEFEQGGWGGEYRTSTAGVTSGLGTVFAGLGDPARAARCYQQARAVLEELENYVLVGMNAARSLADVYIPFFTDDLAGRQALADIAEAAWQRSGDALPAGASSRGATIGLLLLEGHWAEARRLARADAGFGFAWHRPYAVYVLTALAVYTGDADTALRRIGELLPDGPRTEPGDVNILAGLELQRLAVELALNQGDDATAAAWLEAHEYWIDWSEASAARPAARRLRARWLRATGRLDEALAAARDAHAGASEPRQPLVLLAAERLLGELALDRREHARAERHLQAALALADACRTPYERALSLTALARLALDRGDRRGAGPCIEEARAILTALDARPALAQLEAQVARWDEPRSAPAEPATPAGLTEREIEVLRLIAQGSSNREISDELNLSIRTVERHTANIYTKIDAHSRTDATAFAVRRGLV
jgi:ATP/maltotriose-dependent transcriptional regulator MalT